MSIRNQLLKTARKIFAHEGATGISMRRVADQVGVTPTAIYRHFANKDELIEEVVARGFEIFADYLHRPTRASSARARLRAMMQSHLDFAFDHPHYFDFMFLLPRKHTRQYPEDFDLGTSLTFNILLNHVTDGMDRGEYAEADPMETSLTLWAHVHGMISLYRAGRFGDQPKPFRDLFDRSLLRILDGIATSRG